MPEAPLTVLQTPEDQLGASVPMLGLCLWATGYEELDRHWRTRLAYGLRRIWSRVGRRAGRSAAAAPGVPANGRHP